MKLFKNMSVTVQYLKSMNKAIIEIPTSNTTLESRAQAEGFLRGRKYFKTSDNRLLRLKSWN